MTAKPALSNSERTSDFASASSPDGKITRSPPPRASQPAGADDPDDAHPLYSDAKM
jgi:hypothetical protein